MIKPLVVAAVLISASLARASVLQPIGAHYQMLIPAAGSTEGANGTFFRSDIAIVNLLARTQSVRLEWLSQNGTANTVRFLDIPASSGVRSADFVGELMARTGLGSLVITALTGPSGTVDPTARLAVNSRIWTPQPGTAGTTSQSFPVIPVSSVNTPLAALFAVGGGPAPDDPTQYRVNVGIVNLDATSPQSFSIFVPGPVQPVPVNVIVPPRAMVQVPFGGGVSPSSQIIVQNTSGTSRSNLWIAYQSTVNNVTGDAWSELGVAGNAP
jgi:hypothetical protein